MAYDWQKKKLEATHGKLLEVAAKILRKEGVERASVAKIMAGAGLTVGGFYAHFDSKNDLIKESFSWAVNASRERIDRIPKERPSERLSAFLDRWLSAEHRDSPGEGCPLAALALDFTREDEDLRRFFSETLGQVISHRLNAFFPVERPFREKDVIDLLSTLIGALILARATRGTALSGRIMGAVKSKLKERYVA